MPPDFHKDPGTYYPGTTALLTPTSLRNVRTRQSIPVQPDLEFPEADWWGEGSGWSLLGQDSRPIFLSPFRPPLTRSDWSEIHARNAGASAASSVSRETRRQRAAHLLERASGQQAAQSGSPPAQPVTTQKIDHSLSVSTAKVLGNGSNGTRVFRGFFQGRVVAVKCMLLHLVTLANRELEILRKSDDHPNVIRYFYYTKDANFQYIALELCPASLANIIEQRDKFLKIAKAFEPKRALCEITAGLRHLHKLRIVHRDIKPQNILISDGRGGSHRMLISDFGLCKQLEGDQMSYTSTSTTHGAGTVGWRAPEVLRGTVKLDGTDGGAGSSQLTVGTSSSSWSPTRRTHMVDIFSLGCVYYYVLTRGSHPFGNHFEAESNILKDVKSLERLTDMMAKDVIDRMLSSTAELRPETTACLLHPYFWDADKLLTFLQKVSDHLEDTSGGSRLPSLEGGREQVLDGDWRTQLHPEFITQSAKRRRRSYDGGSVRDLLRAIRNASHHYEQLPEEMKQQLGTTSESFLKYFTDRFPKLFPYVYNIVLSSALRNKPTFQPYFELKD